MILIISPYAHHLKEMFQIVIIKSQLTHDFPVCEVLYNDWFRLLVAAGHGVKAGPRTESRQRHGRLLHGCHVTADLK